MTQKSEKPGSTTAPGRSTQRGLGTEELRDMRRGSGAFPRPPELSADGEAPLVQRPLHTVVRVDAEPLSDEELEELTRQWERPAANSAQSATASPPAEAKTELHGSQVFEVRPQSRGPEYHPPAHPPSSPAPSGAGQKRVFINSVSSGTFKLGTPDAARTPQPAPTRSSPVASPQPPAHGAAHAPYRVYEPPLEPTPPPPPVTPSAPEVAFEPPRERRRGGAVQRFWSRPLLAAAALGALVGTTVALAFVQAPVQGWGVVRTLGAPQSLSADVAGRVTAVLVPVGGEVGEDAVVLQIEAAGLAAEVEARRLELALVEEEIDAAAREEKAASALSLSTLARRRELLVERLALKDAEIGQRKRLLDDVTAEVLAGTAPEVEMVEASAASRAASEARLGLVDALAQLDLEAADRRNVERARAAERRARLAEAEARLRHAEAALRVTAVRAPMAGFIEALRVAPGSLVQPGSELARLVPRTPPRNIVAFVPLSEAAHVRPGADAQVELVAGGAGDEPLLARIQHVSREVAPASRLQEVLGVAPEGSFVQVDVELIDSPEYRALEPTLRSGSRAVVSLVSPKRSLGRALWDSARSYRPFSSWR